MCDLFAFGYVWYPFKIKLQFRYNKIFLLDTLIYILVELQKIIYCPWKY